MFVTRAVGDFTAKLSAAQYAQLPARHARREVWGDAELGIYFDDEAPLKDLRSLCVLYCQRCGEANNGVAGG